MLTIANSQIDLLNKDARKLDETQLRDDLAETFPDLPKDELDEFITVGLKKTAQYGVDEDSAIELFIQLMIEIAQDFDVYPKAQEQLTRSDVNSNLTVRLAQELLAPDEWQEAKGFGRRASIAN